MTPGDVVHYVAATPHGTGTIHLPAVVVQVLGDPPEPGNLPVGLPPLKLYVIGLGATMWADAEPDEGPMPEVGTWHPREVAG